MPRCRLANCPMERDGRCLEGHVNACPNLINTADSATPEPQSQPDLPSNDEQVSALLRLHSGAPLEVDEGQILARHRRARVITLVGAKDSGKTSLLARILQLFQLGPLDSHHFAGSKTLPAFEEMNWFATVESGVQRPQMTRSSRLFDNTMLHLRVRDAATLATPVDLLFNDVAGETFPDAIAAESACRRLQCLQRADHLAMIVDGAALASEGERQDQMGKARTFIERVLQSAQIDTRTTLHLITTKLDLLGDEGSVVASELESQFESRFRSRLAAINSWRIAARPMNGTLPTANVIIRMFRSWVENTERYSARSQAHQPRHVPARDMCRVGSDG